MLKSLRNILEKGIKESSLYTRKTNTNDLYIKSAFEFRKNRLNVECISVEDGGSVVIIEKPTTSNSNNNYLKEEIRIKSDLLGSSVQKIHFKGFDITNKIYIVPIGEIKNIEFLMDDKNGTLDSNLHLFVYGNFGSFKNCTFSSYNVCPFASFSSKLPDDDIEKKFNTMPIYEWVGGKIPKGLIPFKRLDKMNNKDVFEVLYGNGNKFITKNKLIIHNFYICLDKNDEENRKLERLPKTLLNKTYNNYDMEDIWKIGDNKIHTNILSTTYQKKIMDHFRKQINYKYYNIENYNYDIQNNIGVIIEK